MKLVSLFLVIGAVAAVELTADNFAKETAGKAVFIKFMAPWCGHCKSLKPAWTKLEAAFAGNAKTVVGVVDCDGTGKALCETHGIEGFPSLKHGSAENLEDYDGEREFDELKTFADALKLPCGPSTLDNCSEEDKKDIEVLQKLSLEELKVKVDAETEELKKIDAAHEAEVDLLQGKYDALEAKRITDTKAVTDKSSKNLKKVYVSKGGVLPKKTSAEDMAEDDAAGEDLSEADDEGEVPDMDDGSLEGDSDLQDADFPDDEGADEGADDETAPKKEL
jgi:thiol-disulfide isomerase/thioredoxin